MMPVFLVQLEWWCCSQRIRALEENTDANPEFTLEHAEVWGFVCFSCEIFN